MEALLKSADNSINLTIHPRCRHLILAMQCYSRAKRGTQLMDYAEDPQHPYEDLIDPLCGGLKLEFPEGRTPAPNLLSSRQYVLSAGCDRCLNSAHNITTGL